MALDSNIEKILSHPRVVKFLENMTKPVEFEVVGEVAPRRAYCGDAGLDIAIQEDVTIYPGDTEYVPAGIKCDVPEGLAVHVITRSSTFRKKVKVVPTVVDSGYKGEISTVVTNDNTYPVTIHKGDYLAQAIVQPYQIFDNEVDDDTVNTRADRKFGSSGS